MSRQKTVKLVESLLEEAESIKNLIKEATAFLKNSANKTIDDLKLMHKVIEKKVSSFSSEKNSYLFYNDIKDLKFIKASIKRLIYDLSLKQKTFQ